MNVCSATIKDAEPISALARQAFYDTYAPYNSAQDMAAYLSMHFSVSLIEEELRAPQTLYLLATEQEEICGYANLGWRSRPEVPTTTNEQQLEIARFYAATDWIGKGVGKLMMQACIDYAQSGHAALIWLDVWKENKKAIAFYAKWGFEIVNDWTFKLGNDIQQDFIMVKRLV